jgi:hypothetical protein
MKFSKERYRHWPVEWYTDMSQFMCNNWNRRNLLVTLNLMSKASTSTYTTEECHGSLASTIPNSNDYWCFTYDQKTSGSNFLQTSVFFTVSTQCYTKGPYKQGEPQMNLRCCFHCPATLNALLGGESIGHLNDASSLLLTDRNKSPHYYIL